MISSSSSTFCNDNSYNKRLMNMYTDVFVEHRISFSSLSPIDQELMRNVSRFKHWAMPREAGMSSSSSSSTSISSHSSSSSSGSSNSSSSSDSSVYSGAFIATLSSASSQSSFSQSSVSSSSQSSISFSMSSISLSSYSSMSSSSSESSPLSSASSVSSQSGMPLLSDQTRQAVIVSITDYPGTVNDISSDMHYNMDRLSEILIAKYDFQVTRFKDSTATQQNIEAAITTATTGMVSGDALVIAFSGHGTNLADATGDEGDTLDEGLYLYSGSWMDDTIRNVIDAVPQGVKVTCLFESCYSGTSTRAIRTVVKPRVLPEESMREVLFTASMEGEYAWPEYFTQRGYFTNALISALNVSGTGVTSKVLYQRLLSRLGTNKQHPQLEGPEALKNARAFV